MISLKEIKRAVNDKLYEITGLPLYGKETKEGYEYPCLFIELLTKPYKRGNVNWGSGGVKVKVTYLQETVDEEKQLMLVDLVKEHFGLNLKVGERYLSTGEIEMDYAGQKQDILQITIDIPYEECLYEEDNTEIMQELEIRR